MLEKLIVGIVVAAAFLYAAWALTPSATRRRLARRMVDATGGQQAPGALARLARGLEKAAGGGAHCHGCDAHSAAPTAHKRPPQ